MNVEIIFDIFLIIIGLYLALFKSYFQEKGKNIATSEDIGKLTLKVESVKQEFTKKNAHLQAKLDLITNLQINHKNDERLTLIEFHKTIKKWIGMLTEATPSLINDNDNDEIQTKIYSYNAVYKEVLSAEALLELYVNDEKLIKLISNLKISTLTHLVSHPTKFLIRLKSNNLEFERYEKMKNDTEEDIEKRSKRHTELLDKRTAIFDESRESMINGLKINISAENEYRDYIKEYIMKISEQ